MVCTIPQGKQSPHTCKFLGFCNGAVKVCSSELLCWWPEFQQHIMLIFKVWNVRQHKMTKRGHHTICKHLAPITQWRSTTTHKNRPLNCQYTLDRTLGRPHSRDKYLTPARNEILIPWLSSTQPSHYTNWGITALHDMSLDWTFNSKRPIYTPHCVSNSDLNLQGLHHFY